MTNHLRQFLLGLGGFISAEIGIAVKIINWTGVLNALLCGAAGALGGLLMGWFFKSIQKRIQKNRIRNGY